MGKFVDFLNCTCEMRQWEEVFLTDVIVLSAVVNGVDGSLER